MQQVGHKFGEVVPQQRKYKLGDNYNDNLDINIETDANIRFNCLNQVLYGDRNAGKKDGASSSIVTDLGILDFKEGIKRETNFFVGYNWLHFLTQIIVAIHKKIDPTALIKIIQKSYTREQVLA
jgi:hypothetical protein